MLEEQTQTAAKFGRAFTVYRYQAYSRISNGSHWAQDWSPGAVWTKMPLKMGPEPVRFRGPPVSNCPEVPHHYYVYGRPAGSVSGHFLFHVSKRGPRVTIPTAVLKTGQSDWRLAVLALPFELSPEGITKIAERGDHVLKYAYPGKSRDLTDSSGIIATFPFLVARSFVRQIRDHLAQGRRVTDPTRTTPIKADEEDDELPAYDEFRLADLLRTLLGKDGYFHDISHKLQRGANDEITRISSKCHQEVASRTLAAEKISAELRDWFDGELFSTTCEYTKNDEPNAKTMLDEAQQIVDGLFETSTGIACLSNHAQNRHTGHFVDKVFSNEYKTTDDSFKLARHYSKASIRIYSVIHGADALLQHKKAPEFLERFERFVGEALFENPKNWKSGANVGSAKRVNSPSTFQHRAQKLERIKADLESITLTTEQRAKLQSQVDFGSHVVFGLDFVNTCLAYASVFEAAEKTGGHFWDETITASTATLGLLGQVFSEQIENLSQGGRKAALKGAAGIGSLWFAYKNFSAASSASTRGDTDAAYAMYAATAVEVLSFAASVGGAFAASNSFAAVALGPAGAALSMIGGVLYLTYEVLQDSELALAVDFSKYGASLSGELPKTASWSPVSPSQMRRDPALATLGIDYGLRQFTVSAQTRPAADSLKTIFLPRVYVGYMDNDTTFKVVWNWQTARASGEHTQHWTLDGSGDTMAISPRAEYETDEGWFFDVDVPEGIAELAAADLRATVSIHKSFTSGGKRLQIPRNASIVLKLHPSMTSGKIAWLRSSAFSTSKTK